MIQPTVAPVINKAIAVSTAEYSTTSAPNKYGSSGIIAPAENEAKEDSAATTGFTCEETNECS